MNGHINIINIYSSQSRSQQHTQWRYTRGFPTKIKIKTRMLSALLSYKVLSLLVNITRQDKEKSEA